MIAPIRVSPFPKTQSVVLGKTHVLECNYTGFPVGKIQWLIGITLEYNGITLSLNINFQNFR
jgi:hypothetical protein